MSGVVCASSGFALVPIEGITASTFITKFEPFSIGRRRPEASGSPSSISTHAIPSTHPSLFPITLTGAVRILNCTPSCCACSTSSLRAGSSSIPRR